MVRYVKLHIGLFYCHFPSLLPSPLLLGEDWSRRLCWMDFAPTDRDKIWGWPVPQSWMSLRYTLQSGHPGRRIGGPISTFYSFFFLAWLQEFSPEDVANLCQPWAYESLWDSFMRNGYINKLDLRKDCQKSTCLKNLLRHSHKVFLLCYFPPLDLLDVRERGIWTAGHCSMFTQRWWLCWSMTTRLVGTFSRHSTFCCLFNYATNNGGGRGGMCAGWISGACVDAELWHTAIHPHGETTGHKSPSEHSTPINI